MDLASLLLLEGTILPSVDLEGLGEAEINRVLVAVSRIKCQVDGMLGALSVVVSVVVLAQSGRDGVARLARTMGASSQTARMWANVGKQRDRVPGTADAMAAGALSAEHVALLSKVSTETATRLVDDGVTATVDEFAEIVAKERLAELGHKTSAARQHASRSVSFFRAEEGCVGIRAVLPPVEGAMLKNRLNQIADDLYRAAHLERAETAGAHHEEPYGARLADALVALASGNASGSGKPAVVVVLDEASMTAELLGEGPVPLGAVANLAAGRAELYALVRNMRGEVLNFGRSRRFASPIQKLVLAVMNHGKCQVEGCTNPWERSDVHHDPPWEHGGVTNIASLKLFCTPHHHHEHETGPPQAAG